MELYEGVLCPINRLPGNLLPEIFIRHAEDEKGRVPIAISPRKTTLLSEDNPPYIFEYICSRRLRLFRSTSQLCASIELDFRFAAPDKDLVRLLALGDCLVARSQQAPLPMSFLSITSDVFSAAAAAQARNPHTLDTLAKSSERWTDLAADLGCIAWLQTIGVIPPALPSLKVLNLNHCCSEPFQIALDPAHSLRPLDALNIEMLLLLDMV